MMGGDFARVMVMVGPGDRCTIGLHPSLLSAIGVVDTVGDSSLGAQEQAGKDQRSKKREGRRDAKRSKEFGPVRVWRVSYISLSSN
jgi:hypothetical protein